MRNNSPRCTDTKRTAKLANAAEVGGRQRLVQHTFAEFQVARTNFINALQGFLVQDDGAGVVLEALVKADVLAVLCCPLVHDPAPGIHSTALDCLGRLAAADTLLSDALLASGAVHSVLASLAPSNAPTIQTAANGVLQALAGSSRDNAAAVVDAGATEQLLQQLETGTPAVKEAAVRTISTLVQSQCSASLTQSLCTASTLSLLVAVADAATCTPGLRHAIITTLGHMCSTGPEAASAVVAAGALHTIAAVARAQCAPHVRAAAFGTLSHVATHSAALAEAVVSAGAIGPALQAITENSAAPLRAGAASLLLEVCRRSVELCEHVVAEKGAAAALTSYLQLEAGKEGCLAGLMIAGTVGGYRSHIAQTLLDASVGRELITSTSSTDALVAGTAAWALEQLGRHGEASATAVVREGALLPLATAYERLGSHKDAQQHRGKAKSAFKALVRGCSDALPLQALVANSTPPELLKHVLQRLGQLLGRCAPARQQWVTSGAMVRLQAVAAAPAAGSATALESRIVELAAAINALFPPDVVAWAK